MNRTKKSLQTKYCLMSKLFFVALIILTLLWGVLFNIDRRNSVELYDNSKLTDLTDNVYIKEDPNIKVYKVGNDKERKAFMRSNPNIYRRYIKNLGSLSMNQDDVKIFVDTRNKKN